MAAFTTYFEAKATELGSRRDMVFEGVREPLREFGLVKCTQDDLPRQCFLTLGEQAVGAQWAGIKSSVLIGVEISNGKVV